MNNKLGNALFYRLVEEKLANPELRQVIVDEKTIMFTFNVHALTCEAIENTTKGIENYYNDYDWEKKYDEAERDICESEITLLLAHNHIDSYSIASLEYPITKNVSLIEQFNNFIFQFKSTNYGYKNLLILYKKTKSFNIRIVPSKYPTPERYQLDELLVAINEGNTLLDEDLLLYEIDMALIALDTEDDKEMEQIFKEETSILYNLSVRNS